MSTKRDALAYTEVINLLNYSVVVIPVTVADKAIDVPNPSFQPLSPEDTQNWEACKLPKFFFGFFLDECASFG